MLWYDVPYLHGETLLELLILLVVFIFLTASTIAITYKAGLIAGLVCVIIIALYNTWVANLLRAFGSPNGGSPPSYSMSELRPIFLQNLATLLFCFYGIHQAINWIKTGYYQPIGLSIWLLLVLVGYLELFHSQQIRRFNLTNHLENKRYIRKKSRALRRKVLAEKVRSKELEKLEKSFNKTEQNHNKFAGFVNITSNIVTNSPYIKQHRTYIEYYCSRLIVSGMQAGDCPFAMKVYQHYMESILPHTDRCSGRTNLAGNILSLGMLSKNQNVINSVFEKVLDHDFDISQIEGEHTLFNLACYYATIQKKERMLESMHYALLKGKLASQFMEDEDFKEYWNDIDFLEMLE